MSDRLRVDEFRLRLRRRTGHDDSAETELGRADPNDERRDRSQKIFDSAGRASITSQLPDEDRHRPLIAQLWLTSRLTESLPLDPSASAKLTTSSPYKPRGEDRPITFTNVKVALHLATLLWRQTLMMIWQGRKLYALSYLARRLIKGSLPACRLWAQSQMLDVVQKSFEQGVISPREVWRKAALSLLLQAGDDFYHFFGSYSDNQMRVHLEYKLEREYLAAQMSLSIPSTSSPYISSLIYEAGVFAGFEPRVDRYGVKGHSGGPFAALSSVTSLLTRSIEIVTQVYLILRTLSSNSASPGCLNPSTVFLISLSLWSPLLRLVASWTFRSKRSSRHQWQRVRRDANEVKCMGTKGDYKQEVVLFGLKDWILDRWDGIKLAQIRDQEEARERVGVSELGIKMGQHGVETAFYVILALRLLPTTLSLGSIRLYQSTASSLLGSVRGLTHTLETAFQSVFYLAAFCEATADPEGTELLLRRGRSGLDTPPLDYESFRQEGGIRIEARDLGFTYPGATKAVLRDINLTIPAGTKLAVIGFNGGGKTTLVKVLMGLYDHSGSLLINDQPAEAFSPQSLHTRTSCLFQDFSKYSFTLHENVGMGDVARMEDLDGIERAIQLGGADVVKLKVGLEGRLNKSGVPDATDAEEGSENRQEVESGQGGRQMAFSRPMRGRGV